MEPADGCLCTGTHQKSTAKLFGEDGHRENVDLFHFPVGFFLFSSALQSFGDYKQVPKIFPWLFDSLSTHVLSRKARRKVKPHLQLGDLSCWYSSIANNSKRRFGKRRNSKEMKEQSRITQRSELPHRLERAGVKPLSSAALGAGPLRELHAHSPDIKKRIIWELQDKSPTQVSSDCLTRALHPLKLINLLSQDC